MLFLSSKGDLIDTKAMNRGDCLERPRSSLYLGLELPRERLLLPLYMPTKFLFQHLYPRFSWCNTSSILPISSYTSIPKGSSIAYHCIDCQSYHEAEPADEHDLLMSLHPFKLTT